VLAQGVSELFEISLGWSTFLISSFVMLLWIPLRERPGFGTLSNIVVIAVAIQLGTTVFPTSDRFLVSLLYCFLGIALVGVGSAFYITCGLGSGPRDGLMTALHSRTGFRIGRVRLVIEAFVLILGAILGGTVGLGTLLFALFIGQAIAISLGVVARATSQ